MNLEEFIDTIISEYEEQTGKELSTAQMGHFWNCVMSQYSRSMLEWAVTRKTAARVVHEFIRDALEEPDGEWKRAVDLRDIYDCRVCANDVAQVYAKGIIKPFEKDIFGLNVVLTERELREIIPRIFDYNKRIAV